MRLFPGVVLFSVCLALLCLTYPVFAAPTDIVPRGGVLLDAFGSLARAGLLGSDTGPDAFFGDAQHTRAELARLLETRVLSDAAAQDHARQDAGAALRAAVADLEPELRADGVDTGALRKAEGGGRQSGLGGFVQPEARIRTGGDTQAKSGGIGIYRVAALGDASARIRYVLSVSDWPEDGRRRFDNEIGPHDFSGINEAYLEARGGRGLTLDVGRLYDRWGPGSRGATMLSDNAPAFDQIRVAFPFSLGSRFGRNYRYTQMASTFREGGQRKYFEARRVEYAFNSHWNADFQEAFKSTRAGSLFLTPLPFEIQTGNLNRSLPFHVTDLQPHINLVLNFGLSYAASPTLRTYGQFLIDDLKSPLASKSRITPRKIGYLIGAAGETRSGTSGVLEYAFVDPTTYTYQNHDAEWQQGTFDQIGLPSGPNSRELYARIGQRITPRLSVAVEGRDRRRHDDSFPAPNARHLAASVSYRLNQQGTVGLTYHDYREDPFPLAPGVPVGNNNQPIDEGNYGERLRLKELDMSYQFYF